MATYTTKQQKAILAYLQEHSDKQVSVLDLCQHLRETNVTVGITTIYRQLEKLEQQGVLHKITTEEGSLYQYCEKEEHSDCFLLKCEKCGAILHADCEKLSELYKHLMEDHHFDINPRKTIFYGLCQNCTKEELQ